MSKIKVMLAAALGSLLAAGGASASVLDVQFSGNFSEAYGYVFNGFTAPQQSGAALIGASGDQWNYFNTSSAANQALVTTSGAASGASLSFSAIGAYTSWYGYDAFGGTATANLMQGYLVNDFSATISGLAADSAYSLYVYTQGDDNSNGRSITLEATGAGSATTLQTNASSYILGDNYMLLQGVTNSLGQIVVTETGSINEADINGFQLSTATSAVPEISTWAMMLTGFLGLGFLGRRARKRDGAFCAAA